MAAAVAVLTLFAAPGHAQEPATRPDRGGAAAEPEGDVGSGLGGMLGDPGSRLAVRLRFVWQPPADVPRQDTDLELLGEELSASGQVWQDGPDAVRFMAGARLDRFATGAVLPTTGREFPDDLWTLRAGGGYLHRYANGAVLGGMVNVTSASDRPYGDWRDCSLGLIAFFRLPQPPRDAWNFGLVYAPLSELPYPLPGVSYLWWPVPEFRVNLGLPFAVRYRPVADLTLDASYMLVRTVHAQATYRVGGPWRVYAAYDWGNQSWYLHEREDDDERLFAYAQRATLGVQTTVFDRLTLDLGAGAVFDRFFFTGDGYGDNRHARVAVRGGPFVALQAGLKW